MPELNEKVTTIISNPASLMYVSTCADNVPNVVPVGLKSVEDGKIIIGDILLNTTLKNISANSNIALAVSDTKTMTGYQIKGTVEYFTEGKYVDSYKAIAEKMFKGAIACKGAMVVTPSEIIITTPGPKCGKTL